MGFKRIDPDYRRFTCDRCGVWADESGRDQPEGWGRVDVLPYPLAEVEGGPAQQVMVCVRCLADVLEVLDIDPTEEDT